MANFLGSLDVNQEELNSRNRAQDRRMADQVEADLSQEVKRQKLDPDQYRTGALVGWQSEREYERVETDMMFLPDRFIQLTLIGRRPLPV
jgi:hypothetical protein